ncbi:acetoacetate decarboxylase family protein [Rhizorhabdus dicambivorans]|uniref:Acetoacetate decarboxylase n=1 Tax=Rhizorhabdus dicambivorans TaxID=1850238 RepID=A0A2A4FS88_9SPHN|nr:acetoacetate decarboxylase family protein [Rhizorhabdus dicambivorans]ATE64271.1 hypothetical protein CMV14_07575 [Rhizorhabdus dicambivorans]PCE40564.1 hypothetical protein COO09_19765 [Rhizorhabdus dicambivorans]
MTAHHLDGQRDIAWLEPRAADLTRRVTEDLIIPEVDICCGLVEIPVEDALRVLPPALHPAIPGLVGLYTYSAPESPIGAFNMVFVGVLARSGVKPRLMVTAGFIDNAEAGRLLSSGWGFPLEVADVRLAVNYDRVRTTVARDGRLLLSFEVQHPVAMTGAGSTLRYPQPFNLTRSEGGLKFVQFDASYGFERVARGHPRITYCDPDLVGGVEVSDDFPVTGTLAKAKMTLHPIRYVAETATRAEDGGVSQLS